MRRRSMLAAIGAVGTAGCLGPMLPAREDDSEAHGIALETDNPLEDLETSFSASVEDGASGDGAAKIELTMHNRAGGATKVAQTVETGPEPPFSGRVGENEHGDRLVLEPIIVEGAETSDDHVGSECWRASEWYLEHLLEYAEGDGTSISLDAGGGVYLPYYLLAHPESDGCVPAGTYRFESSEYGPEGKSWGFDVTLEEGILPGHRRRGGRTSW